MDDVDLRAPARRGLVVASVGCVLGGVAAAGLASIAIDDVHRMMFGVVAGAMTIAAVVLQIARRNLRSPTPMPTPHAVPVEPAPAEPEPAARVVMYATRWCGYCTRARRLLDARGIRFDEIDVSRDHALRRRVIDDTGHRTVPVILIDGTLIGGSDELADLDRAGGLAPLMPPPPSGA